jgi:signal transduction protein with GAF and PtsI domain
MAARLGERIRSLGQIANVISAGGELTEVLELLVMAVCQRSAWSSSSVMVADQALGHSILLARYDPLFRDVPAAVDRWSLTTSPVSTVLRDGRPIVIKDAQADQAFPGYRREAVERNYHVVVVLPFTAKDERGRGLALSVHSHEPRAVTEDDIAFLETVALLGSLAVERTRRIRQDEASSHSSRRRSRCRRLRWSRYSPRKISIPSWRSPAAISIDPSWYWISPVTDWRLGAAPCFRNESKHALPCACWRGGSVAR